ncbi:MAG: prepilin peptidase [Myxococcales bacterium]|nr:MAG: prepilin peptidase [Myxococcales bacterium]
MLVSDLSPWFIRTVAFVLGAAWGSFFNVAIYRWPLEMSVIKPPSHCPACGAPVRAWQNVPILGYVFLRGKAACCGVKLSIRYPLVELLGAVLALAIAELWVVWASPDRYMLAAVIEAGIYFTFVGGLLVATFIDLDCMLIPDEVTLPGAALGLVTVSLRQEPGALDAALGAGLGYLGIQVLFVWGYEILFARRGMGEGDSKLLMMIGAFLGWKGVLFSLMAASFQGVFAAAVLLLSGRSLKPKGAIEAQEPSQDEADPDQTDTPKSKGRLKMPFGPFLALAAVEYLFFGPTLVEAYFTMLR